MQTLDAVSKLELTHVALNDEKLMQGWLFGYNIWLKYVIRMSTFVTFTS